MKRICAFLLCIAIILTTLPTVVLAETANEASEGVQGDPISNTDYILPISDVSSDNYVMSDNDLYSLPVSVPVTYGTSSKTYYHPDPNVTAIKIRLEVDVRADFNDTVTTTDDCYDILYVYDGKGNNIACYDGREMSIFERTQELIIQDRYFTLTLVRKSAQRKLRVTDSTGSYYLPDTYVTRYAPDPVISVTEVKGYSANNSLKMVTSEDGVDILSFNANEGATSVVVERSTNNIDWTTVTTLDCLTQLSTQAKVYNNGNCYYRLNITGGYRAGISNVVRNYVDASEFAFSNGTITNYTGSGNFVVIPSEINGEKVTAIGESAFAKTYIETVIIPDSVEEIGNYAFTKSTGIFDSQLKRVVVEGNNLTEIGEGAFKYCSNLESVLLPDSVENIGDYAFYNCSKLTFTKLPSAWKTIGNYAFYGVGEITNLIIPDGVTTLSSASLSAVKINSLHIGEGLTSTTGLNLANTHLKSISVSQNNQNYSSLDGVLYNKDKTELVRFPVSLCLVSEHVDSGDYKTIIPEGVQTIAYGAFSGCIGILELVLPESLIEIKANAFANCDLLRIRMQNGLQTIGSSAFSNSGLSGYVHIPDSVTSIGSRAFENCMFEYVSLPAGLKSIQSYTFHDCANLTTIYIPKSVGSIQTYAFSGCDDIYHVFYGGTYDEWQALSIANYNVPLTSAKSSSYKYNGVSIAYEEEGFFICKNDTLYYYIGYGSEVTIPSTVDDITLTKIGDYAFDYKNYLFGNTIYDVIIPESITSIGSYAFRGQSIDAVKLPPNLTSIGAYAFAECDLTYIIIPDTVTSLGRYAFADCYQLYAIAVGNGLNSVSVEDLNTAFSNRGTESYHDPIFCFSGTSDELWSGNVGDCDICYGAVFNNATLYITDEGLLVVENVDGKITIWNYQGSDEHLDLYDIDKDSTQQTRLSTYFPSNRLTTIILPSKTDTILSNQFSSNSNLTTIAIPNTVDAIYSGAFANCSKLSLVYFLGTEEEWNAITIKENNDPLLNATIQFKYYSVTYNVNGGTEDIASQKKSHGEDLTLNDTIPIKEGHTFLGWAESIDGEVTYRPGDIYSIDASLTLYAQWDVHQYEIAFDANGGFNAPTAQTKTHGEMLTLSDIVPTRESYKFLGWSTCKDGEVEYLPNGGYLAEESRTLYAVWQKLNFYNVIYDANEGVDTPPPQTKTEGLELRISETIPSRIGYVFDHWSAEVPIAVDEINGTSENDDDIGKTWSISCPTAASISLTFSSNTSMAYDAVYLQLYDQNGKCVKEYTGTQLAGKTVVVQGDSVTIKMWDCGFSWRFDVVSAVAKFEYAPGDSYFREEDVTLCATWIKCSHQWDDGSIIVAPTHISTGEAIYLCVNCGESKTEDVEKLKEHCYGAWIVYDELQHTKTCECGETVYADHSWDEGVITTQSTHTTVGVKTFTCVDCGATKTENVEKLSEHTYGEWQDTDYGYHQKICACGDTITENHTRDEGVVTRKPTHTSTGIMTYTCVVCGNKATLTIAKQPHVFTEWTRISETQHSRSCECGTVETKSHDFTEWQTQLAATCTENGIEYRNCSTCGAEETQTISANGHDYASAVTEPSCTDQGYTTHTCSCGDTYVDTYLAPLGHQVLLSSTEIVESYMPQNDVTYPYERSGDWYASTNKTHDSKSTFTIRVLYKCTMVLKYKVSCEEYGDYLKISVNNETKAAIDGVVSEKTLTLTLYAGDVVEIAYSKDGSWSENEDTGYFRIMSCTESEIDTSKYIPAENIEPTCTDAVVCDVCGQTVYNATGHMYDNDCDTDCNACGATRVTIHLYGAWEKENAESHQRTCACGDVETEAHNWNAGVITTQPTHTTDGERTYTCEDCSATKTEQIAATTEHYYGSWTKADNTIHHRICTCGAVEQENHTFGAWQIGSAATCTENGVEYRKCSKCTAEETRTISATGHSYTSAVTAPTCTQQGYTTYSCACGESYKSNYTSASGHTYSYVVTKTPTASASGMLTGTCAKCSGVTTITLPTLTISDYNYQILTAAACTTSGNGRYTWKNTTYGSFCFDVTIPSSGHSYTSAITAPTCIQQGYTTYSCACGYSYKSSYTNAIGHTYSYEATDTPTASASGVLTGTCSTCFGVTTVTLPKLTTSDYNYQVTKPATCITSGSGRYTWKATTYGSFYFDITLPTTGHTEVVDAVVAPTCVEVGLTEGKHCSVCNKVLIAQTVVPKTDEHSWDVGNTDTDGYIHYICTVCGKTAPFVDTIAKAPTGSKIQLTSNVTADFVVFKNLILDLNGFDITGNITVTSGATLSVKDSQTDDYTIWDGAGYGKIVGVIGGVQAEDGYMMITEPDGISFHRIDLQLTDMTLRSSAVGVYYKCNFAGDEIVAQHVDRYGVALSVIGEPTVAAPGTCSWYDTFTPGNGGNAANGTLLHGVMKTTNTESVNTQNAEMAIYGRAYILTKDGQYIFGECVSRSFREQVELVDDQWNELTSEQQLAVLDMYRSYKAIMSQWDIPNVLKAAQ